MEDEKKQYESTISLLDEAYKNVRMASYAIDCIIDKIENQELEKLLRKQNKLYLDSVNDLEGLSNKYKHEPKDISIFLKGTSFASINMKTMMNNDTSHLAQMLVEGTTMGITQMIQSKNESNVDDQYLNKIIDNIISYEEEFVDSLKTFL